VTRIQSTETELVGSWIIVGGKIGADETCERIQYLTSHYLRKIATSKKGGAWETLFQDPDDGRYWERTYPKGEMHGGGPPMLKCISKGEARQNYEMLENE
jgi:hypothetical protein